MQKILTHLLLAALCLLLAAPGAHAQLPAVSSVHTYVAPQAKAGLPAMAAALPNAAGQPMQIGGQPGAPAAYVRSTTSPWTTGYFAAGQPYYFYNGEISNIRDMDAAFGAANWESLYLESASAAAVFAPARQFVFLEGSDYGANALKAFLQANRSVIENWVLAGGHLFLNAAPNEGGNIDFGFGGTTLNYAGYYTSTSTATVTAGHPVATGPFSPVGTAFRADYFAHATITGVGISTVISGTQGTVLGHKSWGSGYVFLGGMTTTAFHTPLPNAQNLRQNILAFTPLVFCTAPDLTTPGATTTTTDAGVCGASVSFQATATGTTPTLTYSANGAAITSPHVFPVGTTTVTATATNSCGTDRKTFLVTVNDVTPPAVVANSPVRVTLVKGTAALSVSDAGSATDACGVASLVLSRSTFTCADLASSPVAVTLTATDTHGNQSRATVNVTVVGAIPAPAIAVTPASSVYTGGVPTTLYIGYGPQSATLTATGGVSYAWSPAAGLNDATVASPVFTARTPGTYTYTVTATNESGCTNTATVTLTVINASCDKNKVIVCHSGNELCLAASAVNTHLTGHPGDKLGACGSVALRGGAAAGEGLAELAVYPNPANGQATLSFRAPLSGQALMEVYNEMGQRVATIYDGRVEGGQLYSRTLDGQGLTTGLYVCRLVLNGKAEMLRLTIAH